MVYKNVLAIDPGINTGLAYFGQSALTPEVEEFHTLSSDYTDETRINMLLNCLRANIYNRVERPKKVYIEGVQVWRNSVKSMTSASRGDLSFLAYIVGAYYSVLTFEFGMIVSIINPNWKGQLTYSALAEWVFRANGHTYPSDHTLAAVGLGLKMAGKL